MRAEIADLRREYDNFMNAIGQGKAPAGVMARVHALEAQIATKEQLLDELATADVVDLGDALMPVLRSNLERFTRPCGAYSATRSCGSPRSRAGATSCAPRRGWGLSSTAAK